MKENEINLTKEVFDRVDRYIPISIQGEVDFKPLRDDLAYLTANFATKVLIKIENYKPPLKE